MRKQTRTYRMKEEVKKRPMLPKTQLADGPKKAWTLLDSFSGENLSMVIRKMNRMIIKTA